MIIYKPGELVVCERDGLFGTAIAFKENRSHEANIMGGETGLVIQAFNEYTGPVYHVLFNKDVVRIAHIYLKKIEK